MAGQRERDRSWRRAIERTGPMREQDPEGVLGGGREPERLVEVLVLRIVGAPVPRVVDPDERERGATALDDMDAVLHENLSRILHTANDGVLTRVPIVIPQHRDDAQGR